MSDPQVKTREEVEAAFREGFRAGVDITSQMFVRPEQFTSNKALRHAESQAWCNYAKTKEQHGESTAKQT